ncbi:MAG: ComF family protein [Evtepia gabavorous]
MALPQFLLNLLFPPRCPFCDRPVEAVVSAPCPHCLGSDVWLEGAQAVVTGEAFARCVCAGWYREPLRASLRRFKFSGRRDRAKALAQCWPRPSEPPPAGDLRPITWVPVSEDPPPAGL